MALFKSKKNETPCCSTQPEESCCSAQSEESCCSAQTEETEEMVVCDCGNMCPASEVAAKQAKAAQSETSVKVLGSGCKKCNHLEEATKEALAELGMDTDVEHVTDLMQISSYGVMSTPALVVDGKVLSQGRVLKPKDLVKIIGAARA